MRTKGLISRKHYKTACASVTGREEKKPTLMFKNGIPNFHVGQCGGCGLEIRFWPQDGARLTCPNCGETHEVECDEMLDLTTGEKTEIVMLVPKEEEGKQSASLN